MVVTPQINYKKAMAMELEARKGEKLVDPLIYFDEDEGVYKAQAREVQTEA